ncbi:MAG: sulfate permease [Chloroflexi bacterium]|nr:sulfate permease [Chloroflexota bacterium]
MSRALKSGLSIFPVLQWLPHYNWKQWLRPDVIAGITLWGVVVPEGIAYAGLAGMPVQAGLYTILAALIAYAIFGTSRQLAVVATSASAVMLASTLAALNPQDHTAYLVLAATMVLMVGIVFMVAGIFRLGFITNFISRPVMEGFIFGLAVFIIVKQLPKLFGIGHGDGNTFEQSIYLLNHLDQTKMLVAIIGFSTLAALFTLHKLSGRIPASLIVLLAGILASVIFGLSSHGVAVVGNIPSGLPVIGLPQVKLSDLWAVLPGVLGISLVIFCEGLGASDAFASKHDYEVNPNQELIAYGFANLGSGMLGGLAAGGSLSQSSVNDSAGAKSALSLVVAAVLGLVTILVLTPLFAALPEVILAAIIIYAVTHLMKLRRMLWFYRVDRVEFLLGMVALLGVLIFDVLAGLAIAVLSSLIVVIYRSSRPYGSVLGQIPGEPSAYSDMQRHPENTSIPGLIIFRFNSPVYFANASLFHNHLKELIRKNAQPVKAIIIDMVSNDRLDITSIEMLEKLTEELQRHNIIMMATQVHQPVLETVRRSGLGQHFADVSVFPTIDAAVQNYLKHSVADTQ